MVIWINGLSGAGKSTLATEVLAKVLLKQSNVVLIDGDMVREVFGNDLGYSIEDRRRNAKRICQLCKLLDGQGINVVCAILSLFPETQSWNRKNLKDYYEVFIDSPIRDLVERDVKGLYAKFERGEINDVVGMDITFARPEFPNLTINNTDSREMLLSHAQGIADSVFSE